MSTITRAPIVALPRPALTGSCSVERALAARRSVREYGGRPLTRAEVAQLLWAAQGVTGAGGLRSAPSAGALYPLNVYVAVGDVSGLRSGVYRYRPDAHTLATLGEGDRRAELRAAALEQAWIETAAVVLGLAAVYRRTTATYGERGHRYVDVEVGHAAQNVCLQAVALGLGAAVVGAFEDAAVKRVMRMTAEDEPVCLVVLGTVRETAG
jgi:SagB-type dehydrogenase family enzyme